MNRYLLFVWLTLTVSFLAAAQPEAKSETAPLTIAELKRDTPVDFQKEILPILKNNCLACHSQTKPKAELVLETPQSIAKGGESGPAVVPGKPSASLLLKVAAHQAEPIMPPSANKVGANNLSPQELALLQLWIQQGAQGEVNGAVQIEWKRLPEGLNPIFAVALTSDGQYAACGRANQIFIYHLPTGRLVTRLTDPQLLESGLYDRPGVAHRDMVHSLAFNPEGTILASGDYRQVKLWRRAPVIPQHTIAAAARSSAISSNGKWLATADEKDGVRLWDLGARTELKPLPEFEHGAVAVNFSADSTRLAAAGKQSIRIWAMQDHALLAKLDTDSPISAIHWLNGPQHLVTADSDHQLNVWIAPESGSGEIKLLKRLEGHTGPVTSIEPVPNSDTRWISGSADGTLMLWDLAESKAIKEMKHGAPINAVSVQTDGKRFASAGADHITKIWDAENGKEIAQLKGNRYLLEQAKNLEREVAFAKSEISFWKSSVETAGKQHKAELERVKKAFDGVAQAEKTLAEKQKAASDANAGKANAEKALNDLNAQLAKAKETLEAAEKSANDFMAALKARLDKPASNSPEPALDPAKLDELKAKAVLIGEHKVALDRLTAELAPKQKEAADKLEAAKKAAAETEKQLNAAQTASRVSDGELVQAISAAHKAAETLANAQNSNQLAEAELTRVEADLKSAQAAAVGFEKPIRALDFSPDGRLIATGGDEGFIQIWNAETGAPIDVLKAHKGPIRSVLFGSDRQIVSASEDQTVHLWDIAPVWTLERTFGSPDATSPFSDRVMALAFSPDSRLLATGSGEPSRGGEVKIWQVSDGKLVHDFKTVHSDAVFGLNFSPDGKFLASGAADKFVRVIELATGKVTRSFEGHTHHVLGVTWKRDMRTLASCGADNVVKTWDVVTGERKKTIDGFTKEVTSIQYVGITDQLLVSSGDSQVRIVRDNGDKVRSFDGVTDFMHASATTADGALVIAGGQDSVLRVWNGTDGKSLITFSPPASPTLAGH